MKILNILFILIVISSSTFALSPLSMKSMNRDAENNYGRGTYLIIIEKDNLEDRLYDQIGGDFVYFKNTQGFDVDIVSIEGTELTRCIGIFSKLALEIDISLAL